MIHVVTTDNQHLYGRQLDQMFRLRHAFYIEGHGWSGLHGQDGREIDEFDNESCVYLLSLDPFGDVAASVRLNPTTGPTLLKKFADWCDAAPPEAEDCWDISRWLAQPRHRRGDNPRWPSNHQRELMLGILEFCESRGLTRLTMLAEQRIAERIASYGWPSKNLGAARIYENGKGSALGVELGVGPHVLALTRQKTGLHAPVLFEAGSASPPTTKLTPAARILELAEGIGLDTLRRLAAAMAEQIASDAGEDPARAVELVSAFDRLLQACGAGMAGHQPPAGELREFSDAQAPPRMSVSPQGS